MTTSLGFRPLRPTRHTTPLGCSPPPPSLFSAPSSQTGLHIFSNPCGLSCFRTHTSLAHITERPPPLPHVMCVCFTCSTDLRPTLSYKPGPDLRPGTKEAVGVGTRDYLGWGGKAEHRAQAPVKGCSGTRPNNLLSHPLLCFTRHSKQSDV